MCGQVPSFFQATPCYIGNPLLFHLRSLHKNTPSSHLERGRWADLLPVCLLYRLSMWCCMVYSVQHEVMWHTGKQQRAARNLSWWLLLMWADCLLASSSQTITELHSTTDATYTLKVNKRFFNCHLKVLFWL